MIRRLRRAHAAIVTIFGLVACGGDVPRTDEAAVRSQQAVVGSDASGPEDDFVVFLRFIDKPNHLCNGSLVAPNVVLTALHCIAAFTSGESQCDASGEPSSASVGGFVTAVATAKEMGVWVGPDARARAQLGELPAASGIAIVEDGHRTLCSHDIAYVVLDKPVNAPIGRLRLAARPAAAEVLAVAGWGQAENKILPKIRLRRDGITVERVGPPAVAPNPEGDLVPRTFEASWGPCVGDSGAPGFVGKTRGISGVVVRALNLDTGPSPCEQSNVRSVFTVVNDFPELLRRAFSIAKAEPWLEGEAAPGYRKLGVACTADLECADGRCGGPAGQTTCRVACDETTKCPEGLVCQSGGYCEAPPAPGPSPSSSSGAAPDGGTPEEPPAPVSSCTIARRGLGGASAFGVGACVVALFGLTMRRRISRRS